MIDKNNVMDIMLWAICQNKPFNVQVKIAKAWRGK